VLLAESEKCPPGTGGFQSCPFLLFAPASPPVDPVAETVMHPMFRPSRLPAFDEGPSMFYNPGIRVSVGIS